MDLEEIALLHPERFQNETEGTTVSVCCFPPLKSYEVNTCVCGCHVPGWIGDCWCECNSLHSAVIQIDNILEVIDKARAIIEKFKNHLKEMPYGCPVCKGDGEVLLHPNECFRFEIERTDGLGNKYKTCRVCKGKGIIWKE